MGLRSFHFDWFTLPRGLRRALKGCMSERQTPTPAGFPKLLREIKARIQQAQTRAIFAANAELVSLYWDIGRLIGRRQRQAGWGAAVIPRLARKLKNVLPEVKGFSERNIKLMVQFAHEYPDAFAASPAIGKRPLPNCPCDGCKHRQTLNEQQLGNRRLPNCPLSKMGNNWLPKSHGRTTFC